MLPHTSGARSQAATPATDNAALTINIVVVTNNGATSIDNQANDPRAPHARQGHNRAELLLARIVQEAA